MDRSYRAVAALAVSLLLLAVAVLAVKGAYGAFSDQYHLVADFAHAGQLLTPGSNVKYRGVNIGHVDSVHLVDRRVQVRLSIKKGFGIPRDTRATVRPKTLFGEKYVDFQFPSGHKAPFLAPEGHITDTAASEEVEGLFQGAVPLLAKIDATELTTIISELSKALEGEGAKISKSLQDGMHLANVFADTIDAQTRALDSFARFQDAIRTVGPDLNAISANSNLALPAFNQAKDDYARLLTTLKPFADNLADVLRVYRPDIDAILTQGDNVVPGAGGPPGRPVGHHQRPLPLHAQVLQGIQRRHPAQRHEVRLLQELRALLRRAEPHLRVAGPAATRARVPQAAPASRVEQRRAARLLGLLQPVGQRGRPDHGPGGPRSGHPHAAVVGGAAGAARRDGEGPRRPDPG